MRLPHHNPARTIYRSSQPTTLIRGTLLHFLSLKVNLCRNNLHGLTLIFNFMVTLLHDGLRMNKFFPWSSPSSSQILNSGSLMMNISGKFHIGNMTHVTTTNVLTNPATKLIKGLSLALVELALTALSMPATSTIVNTVFTQELATNNAMICHISLRCPVGPNSF